MCASSSIRLTICCITLMLATLNVALVDDAWHSVFVSILKIASTYYSIHISLTLVAVLSGFPMLVLFRSIIS